MEESDQFRINKVLRELNISLDLAIDYLKTQGYNIDPRPTTKINQEIYETLKEKFSSNVDKEIIFENIEVQKVIAVRGNKSNDQVGYPKPVSFFENDFITQTLNKEERDLLFKKTGYLIVKSEYFKIYENFESTEFFTLDFEEDKSFIEYSSQSLKYMSKDGNANSAKKLPLLINDNIDLILEEKQISLPYSGHRFVFIKDDNTIYGPLSIQQINEFDDYNILDFYEYSIQPMPVSFFNLDENYENVIFTFNYEDINDYIIFNRYGKNDQSELYISNLKHLISDVSYNNFILNESDEDIISLVNRQLPGSFKDKKEWVAPLADENQITKERFKRYLELQDKSEKWLNFIENYISEDYLNTPKGKLEIQKFFEKNEELYLEEFREKLKDKILNEFNEESEKLKETRIEKEKLSTEIEKLKNEEDLVKSKSEKLQKINEDVENACIKLNLLNNIESLRQQEEEQDVKLGDTLSKVRKYKEQLEQLMDQYSKESEATMHKKLLDLKPYVEALNGYSPKTIEENSILEFEPPKFHEKELNLDSLISELNDYLKKNNRIIKPEDILNHITCIQQGFMTIFLGLPGVGKTSLATLYSQFLTTKETFIEIPVSRGWNSRKNLLGFFNPINRVYQNDEYGFAELLNKYHKGHIPQSIPAMALLDEANLSPMEHYWSDFISISDRNTKNRFISKQGQNDEKISIPSGFRFISTVNNDHTTEMLSPRLIDRAALVRINYSKPNEDTLDIYKSTQELILPEKIYSQDSLHNIFYPQKPEYNRNEQKILSEIINVLNDEKSDFGKITPISPRKLNSILNYCHVTRTIFFDLTGNQLLNLDYAILQHVLPLINGQGSKYENRLEALLKVLEERNLMKSFKELNNIISLGQDYKTFTFFR